MAKTDIVQKVGEYRGHKVCREASGYYVGLHADGTRCPLVMAAALVEAGWQIDECLDGQRPEQSAEDDANA